VGCPSGNASLTNHSGTIVKRPLHLFVLVAFAALLTQGFQCASSGVSTARRAMQEQDFVKAKTALEEALAQNPNNCEAHALLGDVNGMMNDLEGMVTSYRNALACPEATPKQKEEVSIKMYNAWVGFYNGGIQRYNAFVQTQADSDRVASKENLQAAIGLKPMFTEPYGLLGQLLEIEGDTNKAYATYKEWQAQEQKGFDFVQSKRLNLDMVRGDVRSALGTPVETKVDSFPDGTKIFKDRFDLQGTMFLSFSAYEPGKADTVFEGWTFDPSSDLSGPEQWRARRVPLGPIKAMAFIDYQRGNKEAALASATLANKLKPSDGELGPLRTQLLQDLGKTDEALAEIEQLMKKEPGVVNYRLQYATLLSGVGRQAEAIDQYKKILEMDASNSTALYNLAASYKNVASEKQLAELKKMDADQNYEPDLSYEKDLKVAAEYFEKLRKSPKYSTDIVVMEQLANTYEVLKEKKKVKTLIMELEGLQVKYANDKQYWRIMEGLYARNNMMQKAQEAAEKAK